jgi:hypothetical protein
VKKFLSLVFCLFLAPFARAETWALPDVAALIPHGTYATMLLAQGGSVTLPLVDLVVDPAAGTVSYREPLVGTMSAADKPIRTTVETSWTCADGTTQRVITACEIFSSPRDCVEAHKATVDAMKVLFPPRPQ